MLFLELVSIHLYCSDTFAGGRGDCGTLRSTKSEESLTSLHTVEGNFTLCKLQAVYIICMYVIKSDSVKNVYVLVSIPGDPPSYRPRRPRSTSEALSGDCRDNVQNPRTKDDYRPHPLNGSYNGADYVRTAACVSPSQQEDDLDLCPPAAGIYSLDFDPMSFQCSPASATPGLQRNKDGNKLRKSAVCSSEEHISSPNNNIRGYHSPDISPVIGKGRKKVTSKQLSPKLKKKSFKTQADVQKASSSPPPLPSSSPPVEKKKREAPLADGKELRAAYPHCSPLSMASQASALTDLSQPAQNLPDPG